MDGSDPTEIVREGYDTIARAYHEQRDRFKNQDLLALFASALPAGSPVLDIGCGAGVPVARFLVDSGFAVTGIDVSSSMLELARVHVPEAEFLKMDMRQLKFEANSFGGICAFYSLFHIPQKEHSGVITGLWPRKHTASRCKRPRKRGPWAQRSRLPVTKTCPEMPWSAHRNPLLLDLAIQCEPLRSTHR